MIEQAYRILGWSVLILLGIAILAALYRAITGKLTVDRLIGINMITTMVVTAICILAVLLGESFLTDVAMVYVVLSFLAVLILARLYINLYGKRKEEKQ